MSEQDIKAHCEWMDRQLSLFQEFLSLSVEVNFHSSWCLGCLRVPLTDRYKQTMIFTLKRQSQLPIPITLASVTIVLRNCRAERLMFIPAGPTVVATGRGLQNERSVVVVLLCLVNWWFIIAHLSGWAVTTLSSQLWWWSVSGVGPRVWAHTWRPENSRKLFCEILMFLPELEAQLVKPDVLLLPRYRGRWGSTG